MSKEFLTPVPAGPSLIDTLNVALATLSERQEQDRADHSTGVDLLRQLIKVVAEHGEDAAISLVQHFGLLGAAKQLSRIEWLGCQEIARTRNYPAFCMIQVNPKGSRVPIEITSTEKLLPRMLGLTGAASLS